MIIYNTRRTPMFSTLTAIKTGILNHLTSERKAVETYRANNQIGIRLAEVSLEPEVKPILNKAEAPNFAKPWDKALAAEAIRLHKESGKTQAEFAKDNGFPASRFRSKAAIAARS